MRKIIYLLFVLVIVLDSCVDPFPLDNILFEKKLAVDGLITNEPGSYTIKLFYSSALDNFSQVNTTMEKGASVYVETKNGESEKLIESQPGVYSTKSIQGSVGMSYKLKIITVSGKQYESDFEKMSPPGSIEKLYFEIERNKLDPSRVSPGDPLDAVNILLDGKGTSDDTNLFRWRWTGIYQGISSPELKTKTLARGLVIPDPEPCSGYVYENGQLYKLSECTCCFCWAQEFSNSSVVSNNSYVQETLFNKVPVGNVPITRMHFYQRYYIEVEQLSLTESAYRFWKLSQDQQRATGNLFQPNSTKVRGNIHSISNPDEEVLGVFSVSAVTRKSIFIERSALPYALSAPSTQAVDCRKAFINSTNEKPSFW